MKIRSYLTIVISLCLIGTYVTEYSINRQRQNLQSLTQQHHLNEYAVNEFGHIKHNISQFLITSDLILASGETYLFPGAIEQSELLLRHLDDLNKTSLLAGNRELLLAVRQSVDDIRQILLKAAANGNTVIGTDEVNFLAIYDESSLTLVQNLANVSSQMSEDIESETRHLSRLSKEAVQFQRIVIIGFSLLVFLLWYWTIRQISKPVQELSAMAVKVRDTRTFVGVGYGPQEIQTLSDEISSLTNSLLYQANHDPLTKLNNRREFERQLKQTLNSSRRGDNSLANTLCYIDLDRFKIVNDTCGHSAGDELLTRVADILISNARQNDIVARVGAMSLLSFSRTVILKMQLH
ncbi:MAG: diguanylate cyclase [Gammaproteobacteria bacterium]|nr:diguanylate cyclase [Gammaproteobacteria bacterium]